MSTLRDIITNAKGEYGKPLKDLTVLSTQRDPYRLDTPANHLLGKWLADSYEQVNPEGRRLHLRGLHYALVGRVELPNGLPYTNTDETWLWLSEKAAKAARYLDYLPWDSIRDARNAPPQVFLPEWEGALYWHLYIADIQLKVPWDLRPRFWLDGQLHEQPVRQVVIAEKQGVESILKPACSRREAILALPAGEISDTMIYELLRDAAEDGRPVVIHQLGDFDPAGHQMAVSTSRTVQAIRDTQFPDLDVTVHAVGLTRDHCEEWKLPSTPLKETETRGDRWRAAMGWEQTELDAAVALAPKEFAKVVDDFLLQYFDTGVADRARELRKRLTDEANKKLFAQIGEGTIAKIRETAKEKLTEIREQVADLNAAMKIDPDDVGIEMPEVPDILVGDTACRYPPLIHPGMSWVEATSNLIRRKRY